MTEGCLRWACLAAGAPVPVRWESAWLQTVADECIANGSSAMGGVGDVSSCRIHPGPPCGGRAAPPCGIAVSWKPNCGLPSTPCRGWTVKGRRAPGLTCEVGPSAIYSHWILQGVRSRAPPRYIVAQCLMTPGTRHLLVLHLVGVAKAAVPIAPQHSSTGPDGAPLGAVLAVLIKFYILGPWCRDKS